MKIEIDQQLEQRGNDDANLVVEMSRGRSPAGRLNRALLPA